ncbi:fumarate reductase/succinate dehydrogenase flavoprotein subunit [Mycobacterium intracellulare]|uniref:Putative oxidoreductase/HEAT repeat-containing protein n=1 Tax=Mycobacterium intracellulare (strain ATCC 13950 / DSM 43223 / JCM 6384 / NCTC 13025 / 3600) TaxID=487521 RepID=H8ITA2_MYCIA|nr:fumarate reductase/succinate dehydrogenase flavoprotein subunit [Mycobacterium intracellulare]AFC44453.1 putative oxidoreductase/HEAT repeat-containing protein [Mycobacterium intracellulare ATCC 13950]MEE3804027.1 fumarate reductase/succinate dehydrogenase flavoprotein subunit [Mycobacterium intracellulare]UQB89112.1 fumarate reductase/succinate dehydrogenase flavoprotein subunit [Mycobacterium intracellulare]BCO47620.1 fumarate reductase/succinate dehydrogenase flavoprotein-like FrdA [Mycob
MMQIPDPAAPVRLDCDVLVIGGGTAGTMAALSAAENGAQVLLLEKAHVRHSGALAMGMDGVNNAVIPGKAEPEDYVAEITRANDGIVNQRTIYQTATRGFAMVQRLERYGVKFEKNEHGEYAVRRVHRSGSYVLPMPEGKDVKKALYRVLRQRSMREKIRIENRLMPVRVLVDGGRAVGAAALNTRSGEFVTVGAKAVILATGACGRLGLPASGYLYGTYENPTNAGDGYSMAYHAGAELSGIECFQVNPLIKDYNGPACAYVANPFGGYQVNAHGERFVDSDYWSGQMMAEVKSEIDSARGPIYLKVTHLSDETLTALENILHTTERPTRGTFHANRGHDYRTHDIEMHISEIGLCSGHSASGVWVDEQARTTVPGLYAAGDMACVPHNYMIGAFVFGDLAGTHAASTLSDVAAPQRLPQDQVREAHELIYRPLRHPDGPPQPQVEYKLRRFVNDYVAPPKTAAKLSLAIRTFERMSEEIAEIGARNPHELMRAVEVSFIRDCAEMAARSSHTRTESRWGLYHDRADLPGRDDAQWGYHLNLRKDAGGDMVFLKRPVAPYFVPVPELDGLPPTDRTVYPVEEPPLIGGQAPATAVSRIAPATTAFEPPSPRIAEVLALEEPTVADLARYLADSDPGVRRTAVATLTEHIPDGYAPALLAALGDDDAAVRRTGADGIRELVEVLPEPEKAREYLDSADRVVRAAALYVLAARRAGDGAHYRRALADANHRVRIEAVRALVSVDDVQGVVDAAGDENREVRIAAAAGLATLAALAAPASRAVRGLVADTDPLVRAAGLAALGEIGCGQDDYAAVKQALRAPAWQVREGAARALAGAAADFAVPQLSEALSDAHLDVRKAAVLSLTRWAAEPDARDALGIALKDSDADVRAYARRALEHDGSLQNG